MRKHILLCIVIVLLASARAGAQDTYNDRAKKYIDQYYSLAMAEQKQSGVPASITLGQGILETEAGTSELMTQANNHFGIKCKNGWTGETFLHTDDEENECFKKYKCAADSYKDHSEHLKRNPRYSSLFSLSKTDYASWAVGLKRCGYATNPQYAQRLIKIIEDFRLQEYTYSALDSFSNNNYPAIASTKPVPGTITAKPQPANVAEAPVVADVATPVPTPVEVPAKPEPQQPAAKQVAEEPQTDVSKTTDTAHHIIAVTNESAPDFDNSKVVTVNGLKAVYASKGDALLQYAVKYKVRYPQLLEMNDLPDEPLPFNTYIYLQKKLSTGTHDKHVVSNGETLLMIAQAEGMQLKKLAALNLLNPGEDPVTGAVLQLQTPAAKKPEVNLSAIIVHQDNAIVTNISTTDPVKEGDYITIKKPNHPAAAPVADKPVVQKEITVVNNIDEPAPITPASNTQQAKAQPVAKQPAGKKEDDLDQLKARLDKVVYADDSKVAAAKEDPQQPQLKPQAAATNTADKESKLYTVKRGDTAYSIAKRNGITVHDLMKWNNIDVEDIRAGQTLKIKE